jgi:hypothetical protein
MRGSKSRFVARSSDGDTASSVILIRVPLSEATSSSSTRARPKGRTLASRTRRRSGSHSSTDVLSRNFMNPTPTVCRNCESLLGQLPSTSRTLSAPTTHSAYFFPSARTDHTCTGDAGMSLEVIAMRLHYPSHRTTHKKLRSMEVRPARASHWALRPGERSGRRGLRSTGDPHHNEFHSGRRG